METAKSMRELKETYDLLNKKELLQNRITEGEQELVRKFNEKKQDITEKYDQNNQDTTEQFEIKKREFEAKLKSLQEKPLTKPFNLMLYVISVGIIFTIDNRLYGFGLLLLTSLYVAIDFYIGRKNMPTLEWKLLVLEKQYLEEMNAIKENRKRELLKLDQCIHQERINLNLEFDQGEKIREQLNSKNIVSEYYKNKESVKKFINLFLNGRAKNVEDCIRISEIDDREAELNEKELTINEISEKLASMQTVVSKKEDDLLELEKSVKIRERTLDFNKSLLDLLINNTNNTDALKNELQKSIEMLMALNETLKDLDKVLIRKVDEIGFRIETLEKSLPPIDFKKLNSKVEEIEKEVKEHFNDMNRQTEKSFEDLEYKMYRGLENVINELG